MTQENKRTAPNKKLKPAAPKYILLLIAGSMWFGVGLFLQTYVYAWLRPDFQLKSVWLIAVGFLLGFLIHRFGFSKIAIKNLIRIEQMPKRPCLFSFMSWKSYVLVLFMMGLGITLRLSPIPKNYLSIVYTAIGLALMLSSIKYFKSAFKILFRKENIQVH